MERSDVIEHKVNGLVWTAAARRRVKVFLDGAPVDGDSKTVRWRLATTGGGKLQPRKVFSRSNRDIDPKVMAMHSVTVEFRVFGTADSIRAALSPPESGHSVLPGPSRDKFSARTP